MDDVMIDSYPLYRRASAEILKRHNFILDKIPEDVKASFLGRRVIDVAEIIISYAKINLSAREYYDEVVAVYQELMKKELTTLPGLTDSLTLFKRENFKIALGSSGVKSYIDLVLAKGETFLTASSIIFETYALGSTAAT